MYNLPKIGSGGACAVIFLNLTTRLIHAGFLPGTRDDAIKPAYRT